MERFGKRWFCIIYKVNGVDCVDNFEQPSDERIMVRWLHFPPDFSDGLKVTWIYTFVHTLKFDQEIMSGLQQLEFGYFKNSICY